MFVYVRYTLHTEQDWVSVVSSTRLVGWLVFNGIFGTGRLFSAIMSHNFLYKQISFIYSGTEEGRTL